MDKYRKQSKCIKCDNASRKVRQQNAKKLIAQIATEVKAGMNG